MPHPRSLPPLLRLVTAPTGRGRATLLLGAALLGCGVAWRYPLVAGLGAALVVLVVAEVLSVLAPSGVSVERRVTPRVVERHGGCEGTLRVSGRRRRGLVRLDLADLVDGSLVPVHLPRATRGVTAPATGPATSVAYPVPTPRRGLLDVGPVQLRRYGVTGMAALSGVTGGVEQVRVLPRRVPLGALPRGRRRAVSGGDDSAELGGTDLVGLHEYAMGDDLRRVHWASSARTGTLMVREDAEPSEPALLVLLDDRPTSYPAASDGAGDGDGDGGAADPEEPFEEAVEVAAALCRAATDAGRAVRLVTASGRHDLVVPGSRTRVPLREARELDLLMAEIGLGTGTGLGDVGGRGLDIAVAVTGAAAPEGELALVVGAAPTAILVVVSSSALVSLSQTGPVLALRAATSHALATLWDDAVAR